METFTDNQDREWTVEITVDRVSDVRDVCGIDLLCILEDSDEGRETLAALNDYVILVDTLYVLCHEQADEKNVTDVEFGRSLAGEALVEASEALLEALADFFPPAQKQRIKRLLDLSRKQAEADHMEGIQKVDQKLSELEEDLNQRLKNLENSSKPQPEFSN